MAPYDAAAVLKGCEITSGLVASIEDIASDWTEEKLKPGRKFIREMSRYQSAIESMPDNWLPLLSKEIILGKLFQNPRIAKKFRQANEEILGDEELELVRHFEKHPWFYCVFSVIDTHPQDFLTIRSMETKEEYLLQSESVTSIYYQGARSFLCLLFDNGSCLQTFGIVHHLAGFTHEDLLLYTSHIVGRQETGVSVTEAAARALPGLFLLDRAAGSPTVMHGDVMVTESCDQIAAEVDPDDLARRLGKRWEREESDEGSTFTILNEDDPFFFAELSVQKEAGTITLWSNSQELYARAAGEISHALRSEKGDDLFPPNPPWQVGLGMSAALHNLLGIDSPAVGLHDGADAVEEDESEADDFLSAINAAVGEIIDADNNGTSVSEEEVFARHGVPPETAGQVVADLRKARNVHAVQLEGGMEDLTPPPPVIRQKLLTLLTKATLVSFNTSTTVESMFEKIAGKLSIQMEILGYQELGLARFPKFIEDYYLHLVGEGSPTVLMYSLYLLDHKGFSFRAASDYAAEVLRIFWQVLIPDTEGETIDGFTAWYEDLCTSFFASLGLIEVKETRDGPQIKTTPFFREWLVFDWRRSGQETPVVDDPAFRESVKRYLLDTQGRFTLGEMRESLNSSISYHELSTMVESSHLAFLGSDDRYTPRAWYFRGGQILICPREEEITEGTLLPGHRMVPFYFEIIRPNELRIDLGPGKQAERRSVMWPLTALGIYYTLFGEHNFFELLAGESSENMEILRSASGADDALVRVSVFDFAEFYDEHNFVPGDYIRLRMDDYERGVFTASYLSKEAAEALDVEEWTRKLDNGFSRSFDKLEFPLEPTEQIAHAYFSAGRSVVTDPALHLGGFLALSDTVGFFPYAGMVYLWEKGASAETLDPLAGAKIPGTGTTASLDAILEDCGFAMDGDEITSYMLNSLFLDEDRDACYDRIFEGRTAPFVSAAQEEAFFDFTDVMWERLEETYDKKEDDASGPARSRLIDIQHRFTTWIRSLDSRGLDPADLPAEDMLEISRLSSMIVGALALLNEPIAGADAGIDELLENIDNLEELSNGFIANIESQIGGEEPGTAAKPTAIYQLNVRIDDIQPPIWRRIRVPGHFTLEDLHDSIQNAFGWENSHLHSFLVAGSRYADIEQDDGYGELDESKYLLQELGLTEGARFSYVYDYGDDWRHTVLVEKIIPADTAEPRDLAGVTCTAAKRVCPPEDCGGVPGYVRLTELICTDTELLDEADAEFLAWAEDFEPERVDLEEINRRLRFGLV